MTDCKHCGKPLEYSRDVDEDFNQIPYVCECQELNSSSIDKINNIPSQDVNKSFDEWFEKTKYPFEIDTTMQSMLEDAYTAGYKAGELEQLLKTKRGEG